jgi:hypothetical protein
MYKSFEGFHASPQSLYTTYKEGATFINDVSIQQNIDKVDKLDTSIQEISDEQYKIYTDITQDVGSYINQANNLIDKNDRYHYNDIQDHNELIKRTKPKDIRTTLNDDINKINLYQNTIYISGVIACSTLIIVLLMMSKK